MASSLVGVVFLLLCLSTVTFSGFPLLASVTTSIGSNVVKGEKDTRPLETVIEYKHRDVMELVFNGLVISGIEKRLQNEVSHESEAFFYNQTIRCRDSDGDLVKCYLDVEALWVAGFHVDTVVRSAFDMPNIRFVTSSAQFCGKSYSGMLFERDIKFILDCLVKVEMMFPDEQKAMGFPVEMTSIYNFTFGHFTGVVGMGDRFYTRVVYLPGNNTGFFRARLIDVNPLGLFGQSAEHCSKKGCHFETQIFNLTSVHLRNLTKDKTAMIPIKSLYNLNFDCSNYTDDFAEYLVLTTGVGLCLPIGVNDSDIYNLLINDLKFVMCQQRYHQNLEFLKDIQYIDGWDFQEFGNSSCIFRVNTWTSLYYKFKFIVGFFSNRASEFKGYVLNVTISSQKVVREVLTVGFNFFSNHWGYIIFFVSTLIAIVAGRVFVDILTPVMVLISTLRFYSILLTMFAPVMVDNIGFWITYGSLISLFVFGLFFYLIGRMLWLMSLINGALRKASDVADCGSWTIVMGVFSVKLLLFFGAKASGIVVSWILDDSMINNDKILFFVNLIVIIVSLLIFFCFFYKICMECIRVTTICLFSFFVIVILLYYYQLYFYHGAPVLMITKIFSFFFGLVLMIIVINLVYFSMTFVLKFFVKRTLYEKQNTKIEVFVVLMQYVLALVKQELYNYIFFVMVTLGLIPLATLILMNFFVFTKLSLWFLFLGLFTTILTYFSADWFDEYRKTKSYVVPHVYDVFWTEEIDSLKENKEARKAAIAQWIGAMVTTDRENVNNQVKVRIVNATNRLKLLMEENRLMQDRNIQNSKLRQFLCEQSTDVAKAFEAIFLNKIGDILRLRMDKELSVLSGHVGRGNDVNPRIFDQLRNAALNRVRGFDEHQVIGELRNMTRDQVEVVIGLIPRIDELTVEALDRIVFEMVDSPAIEIPELDVLLHNFPVRRQVWNYNLGVRAMSAGDACTKVSNCMGLPNNLRYNGRYSTSFPEETAVGTWVVERVDIQDTVETKRGFVNNADGLLHDLLCSTFGNILGFILVHINNFFGDIPEIELDVVRVLISLGYLSGIDENMARVQIFSQDVPAPASVQIFKRIFSQNFDEFLKEKNYKNLKDAFTALSSLENYRQDFMVELEYLLDFMGKDAKLPSSIPSGIVIFSRLNRPHVMFKKNFNDLNFNKLYEIFQVKKKGKVCLSPCGSNSHFTIGHERRDNCCGMGIEASASVIYANSKYLIASGIKYVDKKLGDVKIVDTMSSGFTTTEFPFRTVFGVLNRGHIVGNGVVLNVGNSIEFITATHVVGIRRDGRGFQVGGFSNEDLDASADIISVENSAIDAYGPVISDGKFFVAREINIRSIFGQDYKCKFKYSNGEVCAFSVNKGQDFKMGFLAKNNINPNKICWIYSNGTFAVPVVGPVESKGECITYDSTFGVSGAPLMNGYNISGIHLGGDKVGNGLAWARLKSRLDRFGKVDYDLVRSIPNVEFNLNSQSVNSSEIDCDMLKGAESGYASSEDNMPSVIYVKPYGNDRFEVSVMYDGMLKERRSHDIGEWENIIGEIHSRFGDVSLLIANTVGSIDAGKLCNDRDGYKKLQDRMMGVLSQGGGRMINIPINIYQEAVTLIGEEALIELLKKDLAELVDMKNVMAPEIANMNQEVGELKALKKILETVFFSSDEYQNYLKAMRDFTFLKEDYQLALENLNSQKRKFKDKMERIVAEREQLKRDFDNKSKNHEVAFTERIKRYKDQGKKILENIMELEQQKKASVKYPEDVAPIKKQVDEIDARLNDLKVQRKNLLNELEKKNFKESDFLKELKTRLDSLKEEYKGVKEGIKRIHDEKTVQQKNMKEQYREEVKKLDAEIADRPKSNLIAPVKPKAPVNEDVRKIENLLQDINLVKKYSNKKFNAIDKILSNAAQEESKLAIKDMIVDSEAENQDLLTSVLNRLRPEIRVLSKRDKQNLADGLLFDVYNNMQQFFDDGFHLTSLDVQRVAERYYGLWDIFFHVVVDTFGVEIDELKFGVEEIVSRHHDCFSQSLNGPVELRTVYIDIQPSEMNRNLFLMNSLNGKQPAGTSCNRCDEYFECERSHIGGNTGTLMDIACTKICERDMATKLSLHNKDCNKSADFTRFVGMTRQQIMGFPCSHAGSVKIVKKCPIHIDSNTSCFSTKMKDASDIAIVVNSEVQFVPVVCLLAIVYRSSINHEKNNCNRPLTEAEHMVLQGIYSNIKTGLYTLPFRGVYLNLSGFDADFVEIFLANLYKYLFNVNDQSEQVKSQSLEIEDLKRKVNQMVSLTDFGDIVESLKKEIRELKEEIMNKNRIFKDDLIDAAKGQEGSSGKGVGKRDSAKDIVGKGVNVSKVSDPTTSNEYAAASQSLTEVSKTSGNSSDSEIVENIQIRSQTRSGSPYRDSKDRLFVTDLIGCDSETMLGFQTALMETDGQAYLTFETLNQSSLELLIKNSLQQVLDEKRQNPVEFKKKNKRNLKKQQNVALEKKGFLEVSKDKNLKN